MKHLFGKKNIFNYNYSRKIWFVVLASTLLLLLTLFTVSYLVFLKDSDWLIIRMLRLIIGHVTYNIKQASFLGAFYVSTFGGLFFITVPLEAAFFTFLRAGINPLILLLMFLSGLALSFTINYYIGMKMSNLSKKIISPKKFYRIKGVLNRYGALGIFIINLLPLPAQILSAIVGVFNYNRPRFYTMSLSGQLIKYLIMILGYFYIL